MLDHIILSLSDFATNEQGSKSVVKALRGGGKEVLDRLVGRMVEPTGGCVPVTPSPKLSLHTPLSGRRAIIVDLALSVTGSQLITTVFPRVSQCIMPPGAAAWSPILSQVEETQRALLYGAICGHLVTLRSRKTGSQVVWLL